MTSAMKETDGMTWWQSKGGGRPRVWQLYETKWFSQERVSQAFVVPGQEFSDAEALQQRELVLQKGKQPVWLESWAQAEAVSYEWRRQEGKPGQCLGAQSKEFEPRFNF